MKIKLTAGTNVGQIRQNNEDNFIVSGNLAGAEWKIPQIDEFVNLGEYGALLVVADGMGGANAGEVASDIAVKTVKEMFIPEKMKEVINSDEVMLEFEKDVVKAADLKIVQTSKENPDTQGMGTTIVLVWIYDGKAYICWCGDSRCYVFNANVGLTRLSKDHSFVQELIDKGELEAEYASEHPMSNVITRCLGDVDVRANPDVRVYDLVSGDILLLCSDGLSSMCKDDEIADVIQENQDDLPECRNALIGAALAAGGYDNVTVCLCAVQCDDSDVQEVAKTLSADVPSRRIVFFVAIGLVFLLFLSLMYVWWRFKT